MLKIILCTVEDLPISLRTDNYITPHQSNNYQPQTVTQLVASLRSLTTFAA